VIDLQPEEDISLLLMNKDGLGLSGNGCRRCRSSLSLDDGGRRRIAYERLLLDVLAGNHTLFVRRDEVEAQPGPGSTPWPAPSVRSRRTILSRRVCR
jgi:glucose-6-phosphate 1-dehydrogenase